MDFPPFDGNIRGKRKYFRSIDLQNLEEVHFLASLGCLGNHLEKKAHGVR
jgi:hypothetical protein